MRLVIFGATGGTGRRLIDFGLSRGHEIVAAVRRPEAITKQNHLHILKCDVLDANAVEKALVGADAAISAIGPSNNKNPGTLISSGIKNIVMGCEHMGVKRLIFESGLMVGDGSGLSIFGKMGVSIFRRLNWKLCQDKRIAEDTIYASNLDWIIVRPTTLADLPPRDDYKFGSNVRLNPAKKVSFADVAGFMIKLAEDTKQVCTVLDIGH